MPPIPARARGIVYVILVIAGILAGLGTALVPDVAGEATLEAAGWVESILALLAVVAGVLARMNLTPTDPALTDLERHADAEAAALDPTPGVYTALTDAERAQLELLRADFAALALDSPVATALAKILRAT